MIYQDSFYGDLIELSFEEAVQMISRRAGGDLLKGMLEMRDMRDEVVDVPFFDEEDFQDAWRYEIKAYNIVFAEMGKLFQEKV